MVHMYACLSLKAADEYLCEKILQSEEDFCIKFWKSIMVIFSWIVSPFAFVIECYENIK